MLLVLQVTGAHAAVHDHMTVKVFLLGASAGVGGGGGVCITAGQGDRHE